MEAQPEVRPLTQPGDSSLMSDTVAQQLAVRRIAYNTRLHNIEIQLLKLENKLLMESLNKNNDTTLVNRLEVSCKHDQPNVSNIYVHIGPTHFSTQCRHYCSTICAIFAFDTRPLTSILGFGLLGFNASEI